MKYSIDTNFKKLKEYEEIEDYYGEIDDMHLFLQEVFCDRVESQKYIVRANKEIERLKNILKKIDDLIEDIDNRPLVDEDMFGVFYNEYQSLIEEDLRGDSNGI